MAAITVGRDPVAGISSVGAGFTWLDTTTPSNGSGTLTQARLYVHTAGGTWYIGIFFWNGANYECRSAANLGSITDTGLIEKAVSLAVQTGDLIGFYCSATGKLYSASGSSGDSISSDGNNYCSVGATIPSTFNYTNLLSLQAIASETPTVTTQAASDVNGTNATGNGNITDTGGENCDKRGVVYSTLSHGDPGNTAPADSDYEDYEEESGSFGTGAFTINLTNLTPGTTYYARAYAHNSQGYSYGGEVSFTTLTTPTVTTQAVSGILGRRATGNGTITYVGGDTPTKRGVCWNTTGNPTVADHKAEEEGSFGAVAFTESMGGLVRGQKYYVRAYAYNSYGYGYGSQVEMIGGYIPSETGDGTCYNTWGDWDICRAGNAPQLVASGEPIKAVAYQVASFWIYRGFLYFDLSHVPVDYPATRVVLKLYGKTKGTTVTGIVVVEGYQADPLVATSYQGQASTQTILGSISTNNVTLEEYNSIELNSDGLALVISQFGNTLKLCLKDDADNSDGAPAVDTNRDFTFYSGETEGKEPSLVIYVSSGASKSPTDLLVKDNFI